MAKRIVLTGGGTAGHVTPHLSLIPRLKEAGYEIHYIGTENGIEHQMIAAIPGITYHSVKSGKLRRYFSLQNFSDPFKVIAGAAESVSLMRKLKPDVVFSKGGFVSVPVVVGAWMCHVPTVCHESDLTPGLANRICAKFAWRVAATFPECARALGEKGARYIISALLAIACVGWFGIQSATCGSAFASMVANMLGTEATPIFISISSIVWGVIMLLTACVGFKGLKWLNYIAVPLLVIVCLYGLIAGIVTNDGGSAITNYAPENSSGMVFGISMVVASFALGGVISADYCRFAKSRSDVVKSSVVGVIPAGLFMLLTGALMSIVTGQYDISAILASLGVPFVGLVALVLATWTTNVTNAYSGGLALSNLLGFDESKFKVTTGVAGAIGTLLAAFGLLNAFQSFLSLMSALIPPLAGVLIASYWIVGKGKRENFSPRPGFSAVGVISFAIGAVFACITGGTFASFPGLVEALPFLNWPFFVGPVNGIVVSLVLYVGLAKLTSAKRMPAKQAA